MSNIFISENYNISISEENILKVIRKVFDFFESTDEEEFLRNSLCDIQSKMKNLSLEDLCSVIFLLNLSRVCLNTVNNDKLKNVFNCIDICAIDIHGFYNFIFGKLEEKQIPMAEMFSMLFDCYLSTIKEYKLLEMIECSDQDFELLEENDKASLIDFILMFDKRNELKDLLNDKHISNKVLLYIINKSKDKEYDIFKSLIINNELDGIVPQKFLSNLDGFTSYDEIISSNILDNKKYFDIIKNKAVYSQIFFLLPSEKRMEMLKYMIDSDELIEFTASLSGSTIEKIVKEEPSNQKKYKKWFLEYANDSFSNNELYSRLSGVYIQGYLSLDIDYEKVFKYHSIMAFDNRTKERLFTDYLDKFKDIYSYSLRYMENGVNDEDYIFRLEPEYRIPYINRYYKSLPILDSSADTLTYKKRSELFFTLLKGLNENTFAVTNDEELITFIRYSVAQTINIPSKDEMRLYKLIKSLDNRGIEFYRELFKKSEIEISPNEPIPLQQYIFTNDKKISRDPICIENALNADPNMIIYIDKDLIDEELILKISDLSKLNYDLLPFETFKKLVQYRKKDMYFDEKALNLLLLNVNYFVSEEEEKLILDLCDTEIFSELFKIYSFLQSDEESLHRAMEKDPKCLFTANKSLKTLENARLIKDWTNINEFVLFASLNYSYDIINNDIISGDKKYNIIGRFLALKGIDYSKITNTSIYQGIFDYDITLFEQIYHKYEKCLDFLKEESIGYIKTFSFLNLKELPFEKYGMLFDKNGATQNLKEYLSENMTFGLYVLENGVMHTQRLIDNTPRALLDLFSCLIVNRLFITQEQLDFHVKYLSPRLLCNLDNNKLVNFLRLDITKASKIYELINKRNATSTQIADAMLDSLLQAEFSKYHKEELEIYTSIQACLLNRVEDDLNQLFVNDEIDCDMLVLELYLSKICGALDIDSVTLKKAVIDSYNGDEKELRDICNKYIAVLREEYRKANVDFAEKLGFEWEYDYLDVQKKMLPSVVATIDYSTIHEYIKEVSKDEFLIIKDMLINNNVKEINKISKKKIGVVRKFLKEWTKKYLDTLGSELNPTLSRLNVRKKYILELEDINYIDIISQINVEMFFDEIYSNEQVFNNLLRLFNKYYLGQIPQKIEIYCKSVLDYNLYGGINNIGSFINKFYNILLNKQAHLRRNTGKNISFDEITFSFTELVQLISTSNGVTEEVRRLMGYKEYNDFVTEAGPNKNNRNKAESEKKVVDLISFLYYLDEITIPSTDEIITSPITGKSINIISGNRTSTSNLCHGERTGACMRLNGIGEGLFLMCLMDKNWFHIRLEEPVTHEYISRVSGFRNGNTVYLNQLRDSGNLDKYSNNDLQEFIEIYAESLIEQTKSSKYPIENVFINTNYAMTGYSDRQYSIGKSILHLDYTLGERKKYGMRDSSDIWIDVDKSAYLLATTKEGSKDKNGYIPIKNGPKNAEVYRPIRDKIVGIDYSDVTDINSRNIVCDSEFLTEKINQVQAIIDNFLGKDYRYDILDIVDLEMIKDGFAGEDWYVYIDAYYNINYQVMENIRYEGILLPYHNKEIALLELEKYKDILEKRYNLKHAKKKENI